MMCVQAKVARRLSLGFVPGGVVVVVVVVIPDTENVVSSDVQCQDLDTEMRMKK